MMKLSVSETIDFLTAVDSRTKVLLRGPMGIGKTAIGNEVAKRLGGYKVVYIDCQSLNFGDLTIPAPNWEARVVDWLVAGHIDYKSDLLIIIDEFPKAPDQLQKALSVLFNDRRIGSEKFTENTRFILTGNTDEEGLGDMIKPHTRNRFTEIFVSPATPVEWVDNFARQNGISDEIITWVLYDDHKSILEEGNKEYGFDVQKASRQFLSYRSLEASDRIFKAFKDNYKFLHVGLTGTSGPLFADSFLKFLTLSEDIPTVSAVVNQTKEWEENKTGMSNRFKRLQQSEEHAERLKANIKQHMIKMNIKFFIERNPKLSFEQLTHIVDFLKLYNISNDIVIGLMSEVLGIIELKEREHRQMLTKEYFVPILTERDGSLWYDILKNISKVRMDLDVHKISYNS